MKRFNRLGTILASAILAFSSILALAVPSMAHAAGTTYKWTGAGTDNLFTTAANWSTMTAPTSGNGTAILEFPMSALATMDNLSKSHTVTNNISGLNIAQIKFTGSAPTGSYTIDGASLPIDLTGTNPVYSDVGNNVTNYISATLNINNPSAVVSTTNNQTMQTISLSSVNLVGNLTTSGRIALYNISGGHTITAGVGVLSMYSSDGFYGSLVANGLIYYVVGTNPQFASLTVNNGGGIEFSGSGGTKTLTNSMTLSGAGGSYSGNQWKTIEFSSGDFTLNNPITLGSNVNIGVNSGATVTVSGAINGGSKGYKIFYDQADKSLLTFTTPAIQASFSQGSAGSGSSSGTDSNKGSNKGGGNGTTVTTGGKGGGGVIPINTAAPGAPDTGLAAIMNNPITIAVTTVMCGSAIALIAKRSSVLGLLGR